MAGTIEMKENMLKKCKQRIEADVTYQWAIDVLARVEDCVDLVAAESRYHSNCLLRFNQNKASEKIDEPKSGRKPSQKLMYCFSEACDWLEGEVFPHSVVKLREKMMNLQMVKMFTEFNISRNYSQTDIRTISPSVVNQDEKIFCTSNKWLTTQSTPNTEKEV